MACHISLPIVVALVSSSLVLGSNGFPTAVLLDDLREHQGPDAGMYDDAHYVWLSVEQLARERDEWRYGLNPVQDNVLVALEVLEELGREEDDGSLLGAMVQPGAAKQYGLRNGQTIPTAKIAEICNTADFDASVDVFLSKPPDRFDLHAQEARGAILGRVLRIAHGFTAMIPALLLEFDIEETLFVSDYSLHPHVVVAAGGYVHDGTVYCSVPTMMGWHPEVGDRLIFMPVTGPWDKDGQVMTVVDPSEVYLVGEPDESGVSEVKALRSGRSSVPSTLVDFRHRLWSIRDQARHSRAP